MNKTQRINLDVIEDEAVEYFINGKKTTKEEYFNLKNNENGANINFECRGPKGIYKYKGVYDKRFDMHGFGTLSFIFGDTGQSFTYEGQSFTYEGYFYHGGFHGKGKLTTSNDKVTRVYEGNFFNGFKHGQGKEIRKHKTYTSLTEVKTSEYEGKFKLNRKSGYGTLKAIYFDGSNITHVGNFKDNLAHGQGKEVFKYKNFIREGTGNFKDGYLNGKGVSITTWLEKNDKLVEKGNFKDYKMVKGVSRRYNLDDNKLTDEETGTFKNGYLYGRGVKKNLVKNNYFVSKGIFVEGKLKDGTIKLKDVVSKYKNFKLVEEKDETPEDIERAVRLSKRKQIKEALEKQFPIRARKTQARKKHIAKTKKIFSKKIEDDGGFEQYFDCGKFGFYIEVKDLIHTYDISHVKKKGNEVNFTKSFDTVNELIECYYNLNGSFHSVKEFEAKSTARQTREIQEHLQNQAEEARRRIIEQEQQRTMFKRQQIEYEWDYLKSLRENAGLSAKKGESLKSVNKRRQEFEQDKTVVELDKRGNKRKRKISNKAKKRKARTETKRSRKQ